MRILRSGCLLLSLACWELRAQPRLAEYALILSDPPMAKHVSSRGGLTTQAAVLNRAQIRDAQTRLTDELARHGIRVTGSAQLLANAVFVRASAAQVAELGSLPGVMRVEYIPPIHRKLNTALPLANASAAWTALGGSQNAGKGVKIGILDTGMDQNHPAFQDSSLKAPSGFPKGDTNYTNSKVIVARSYAAMLPYDTISATDSRPDDDSPRDRSGHGTAIAMIAAGKQVAAPLAAISGIAPKAYLGNYKIFGSPGVNDTTTFAVIIQALEDAINDGMDILVLPVGDPAVYGALEEDASCAGPAPGFGIPADACDVRAQAVENAANMNVTVVVPAGNDGTSGMNTPTLTTINTPGTAPSAITVGASTNSHRLYGGVIVPGQDAPTRLIYALFGDGPKLTQPLTAPLHDVSTLQSGGYACQTLPAKSLNGAIALVQRGNCGFDVKVINAENAGAVGVIIVQSTGNQVPFPPTGLVTTGIPAVVIGSADGATLESLAKTDSSQQVTLDPAAYAANSAADVVADFSSRGPAIWKGTIKPELLAPGADLYTAAQSYDPNGDVYGATGFSGVSGTSFASGLVAGAAALVKQLHPGFTPAQIKSALVNTASSRVTDNGTAARIVAMGAGKLDAGAAVNTAATVEPSTISFGALDTTTLFPVTGSLTLTNVSNASMRFSVQVSPTDQDVFARVMVSPNSGLLGAGQRTQIAFQLNGSLSNPGSYEGVIQIQAGSTTLRVPYLYLVSDGIAANVLPLTGTGFTGSVNDQGFFLILKLIDQYGVPIVSEPVQFQVTAGNGAITGADPTTDVLGIAAAVVNFGSSVGDQIYTADIAGVTVEFDGRARARSSISSGGVVNAGSHLAGSGLAPGSYIEIYGAGLSEVTDVASTPYLPVALAGVSVSFDAPNISVPGHIYFVTPSQVDVQIPWELQGVSSASMKVSVDQSQSAVYTVPLAAASPAPFTISNSSGSGQVAAALDQNNHVISSANPAQRSQTISLYVNGLGAVDHTPASGDPTPSQPLPHTSVLAGVSIGGVNAPVSFSGLSPYSVGLYQINVAVPALAPTGLQPVVVAINGIRSKPVNLPVQ